MNKIAGIIGGVNPPPVPVLFQNAQTGLALFISAILRLLIIVGGIYALFSFIFAGYLFLSSGGDPKKIADAWTRIWQSALGLIVIAGSYIIAAIIGYLLFGDFDALLQIRIFGI